MSSKRQTDFSSSNEICGSCLSMISEEALGSLLYENDVDVDVRPFSELIKGTDVGCPCCVFIVGMLDYEDLSKYRSAVVSVSCQLLPNPGIPKHQKPLQVRFWAHLYTELGGSVLKCVHWNANAFEGDEAADFLTARADHKYTPGDLLIRRIKERLDECGDKHKCCPQTQPRLPTRVIEVGVEGDTPAIHITQAHERGVYVALSYCWGGPQKVATTISSLQSMTEGFSMDSLPKTIQDAVRLIRCLGFRYLWIDAFCIIQDSEADKLHEINEMGTIYKNAALTIAAASAESVNEGFLEEVPPPQHCIIPFRLTNGHMGNVYFGNASSESPLDLRAWALQEVVMSSRILYFGRSGVYWGCLSKYRNLLIDEILTAPPYPRLPLSVIPILEEYSGTSPIMVWWKTLVTDYSQRALAFSEDKLPALAGIASHFQQSFSLRDTYLAGIWQSFWVEHLGWYDQWYDAQQRAKTSFAARSEGPTWSWASFGGPVAFDLGPFISPDAEIISAVTFLVNSEAPLGRVHGGMLAFRARLAKLTRAKCREVSLELPKFLPKKSEFRMDHGRDQPEDQESLRYMFLGDDSERSGMGLILRPKSDGRYVRVGQVILRPFDRETVWPSTMEKQLVTIV